MESHRPVPALQVPLRARNGSHLRGITVARISGHTQDEKSLTDQGAMYKQWVRNNTDQKFTLRMIATRGSGELLDRSELKLLRKLIRNNKYDFVLAEDLARICRRVDAIKICESCEDHGVRLIAMNDHIDTALESWRLASFFAAMRHEQYNSDTGKRIRRTQRNRFMQGGIVQTLIFCYDKPLVNCRSF